jgi:assimilatory nitrate reductase catalytic subunit
MSRTGTVAQLVESAGEPSLLMSRSDFVRRGFAAGDLVRVESKRGGIFVPIRSSGEEGPGSVFLAMHWGSGSLGGDALCGVNALTSTLRCPISQQPALKHAAVRVTKADLPWRLAAFGYPDDGDALRLRDALRSLLEVLPYVSVTLMGRDSPGVLFRGAAPSAPDPSVLARVDAAFGLDGDAVARYDDGTRGIGRRVRVAADRLVGVRLSGDTSAETWLREWLAGQDVSVLRSLLLLPAKDPPAGFAPRGRVVCTCFDTAERELRTTLAAAGGSADAALREVQASLKCGTNCGSCLPELRRLAAEAVVISAPV